MRKHFTQFDFGDAEYVKCTDCGFVLSKTHYEMPEADWGKLNYEWMALYQGNDHNPDDPRWLERLENQTEIIGDLHGLGLIAEGNLLDYGAGDGKLPDALRERFGINFQKYEHGSNRWSGYLSENELVAGNFSLVLNTSVLEHMRYREDIDKMFNLVSPNGVMAIHTWVAEHVPQDPEWFYLLLLHCSFFSNRSMQLLFEHFGYKCCIYNVTSRLWLWFKQPSSEIRPIVEKANARGDEFRSYIFADKFVDYWK